jgi:N-sulfoglucosamine sulfohydrolase
MVSFLDFAPSLLDLVGVEVPKGLPGFSLFGSPEQMRGDYVFGGKDRMDEAVDRVRYARSKSGFKYIRNFRPELTAGGRVSYQLQQLGAKGLRGLFHNGSLNAVQARWLSPRQPEEFYDLTQDPLEINNLIGTNSSHYLDILGQLKSALDAELARLPDWATSPRESLRKRIQEECSQSLPNQP